MKRNLSIILLVLSLLAGVFGSAQKTIVVIGSSTAFGTGANPISLSWVNRLQAEYRKNTSDGVDTNIINLAIGGTNTYKAMPTGFVPPPGRDNPDPTMNITLALSYNPNIILVNFPSNDIAVGHTKAEIMVNFRTIYQTALAGGAKCFITTTQPRDFSPNTTMMQYQRDLVDSIQNNFGVYSIDFWNPIVSTNPPNDIRPDVSANDGIHVNNTGHGLLFQQVVDKSIFTVTGVLPVKLVAFSASFADRTVGLKWTSTDEETDTRFDIERSSNGRDFTSLSVIKAVGTTGTHYYEWTDNTPLNGKSYYRLKMTENTRTTYSKVISVDNKKRAFDINSVFVDGNTLHLKMVSQPNGKLEADLINLAGAILKKQNTTVSNANEITVDMSNIPPGEYIVRLVDQNGNSDSRRFIKLK